MSLSITTEGSRWKQKRTKETNDTPPVKPFTLTTCPSITPTFPRHGESHSLTLVTHVTGWGKVESDMKDKTRVVPLAFPAFEWHLRENHGAPHASRASYTVA